MKSKPLEVLFNWRSKRIPIPKTSKMIKIKMMEILPIYIWFIFSKGNRHQTGEEVQTLWSTSLSSAPTIESFFINISGLRMSQYSDNVTSFVNQLLTFYNHEIGTSFWGWINPYYQNSHPIQYFEKKASKAFRVSEKTKEKTLEGPLQEGNLPQENLFSGRSSLKETVVKTFFRSSTAVSFDAK